MTLVISKWKCPKASDGREGWAETFTRVHPNAEAGFHFSGGCFLVEGCLEPLAIGTLACEMSPAGTDKDRHHTARIMVLTPTGEWVTVSKVYTLPGFQSMENVRESNRRHNELVREASHILRHFHPLQSSTAS